MHHDRHHITIHKEAIRPFTDPHMRELSAVHEFPCRIEVVDHHIGVLATAALAT